MAENEYREDKNVHDGRSISMKLAVVTLANLAGFIMELTGGILFGSVALLSDAIHMLFDSVSYAVAFTASYITERIEGSDRWTYGLHRVEVVSALINGMLLIPLSGLILWEAYQRFLSPASIAIAPTLSIALFGMAVNLFSVFYIRGEDMSLNEKGAFYHLMGDSGASVAVIVGLGLVHFTDFVALDPMIAAVIALFVIWSAFNVLAGAAGIILQKSPVDPSFIREAVEGMKMVEETHNIHSWQVCSKVNVCTVHVGLNVSTLEDAEKARKKIGEMLRERFGIQHVTLQIEKD